MPPIRCRLSWGRGSAPARDAANLAWKLAAVLQGRASEALLDSYQRERDPHVRAITDMAVFMGKIVCTQNEWAAAIRDRDMTSKPEAERFSVMPGMTGLASGILVGDPAAGTVFPEPWIEARGARKRMDDVAGLAPLLIHRGAAERETEAFEAEGGFAVSLDGGSLLDEGSVVASLLGDNEAILVRPDRYVFGRGRTVALIADWRRYLATGATG